MDIHPDIRIRTLSVGIEKAPLLVIDNLVTHADALVARATTKPFVESTRHYPGTRARAPLSYQEVIAHGLKRILMEAFGLEGRALRFGMCHYSLVTTPAEKLAPLQRIPHVDSLDASGLAAVHYLFRGRLGGTAFYRHRSTGFETVDESRKARYFSALEEELRGPHKPAAEYINGDTPLFEQIECQEGVFNRMLVYRRNALHSGAIPRDFVPDPNPRTGRLSINSFIDVQR